ncbi:MAG: Flp pilus assembly complex ATPase component TadA, partial [Planctomycetota bacterium]|nr:Flp pilus assembly complex ATPase component TadA [Planctomycetota bacterium]
VIQMTRTVRVDIAPKQSPQSGPSHVERLLGIAVARGAAALYLTAQTPPALRLDDEVRIIDGEAALTSADIEAGVVNLVPETTRDSLQRGDPAAWVADLPNVGRVRFSTFRDHRGSGAVLQLIAVPTADQLGFSADIQALATETEGLVVVATPRGAGKSTLLGAFVDLMNRQRNYVITLERQIRLVHDNRNALISQREVPGTAEQVLRVTRGALREKPDVLVIDDLASAESLQLVLEAAGSGLLVFLAVTGASTTAALSHVIDLFPTDRRKEGQALIAERLRGAVAQALLRKTGGGRVVARELLLTTASVTRILTEGQLSELPSAIESGRKHGMTSLTDALVALIRSGAVDVREAYRKADDRDALLDALKREQIDTTPVERLA